MHPKHAHTPKADRPGSRRSALATTIVLVLAVVVAGGLAVVAVHHSQSHAGASPTTSLAKGTDLAVTGPFRLMRVTPTNGDTQVASDATLSVQFSAPVAPSSPTPVLTPPVAGQWSLVTPTTFEFVPAGPLIPLSKETITVPSGNGGVESVTGRRLAASASVAFTVAPGTYLRLQQLLAQLGYLPVAFNPAGPLTSPQEAAQPQQGSFTWRWNEPATLTSQWTPGASNEITTGAVMAFESQHNMTTDGIAGPTVWSQLLAATESGALDPNPYDYVTVTKNLPESATVYSNGSAVYSTPVNTGVPGATTQSGTFPVYLRYTVTTMSGTNPNGTTYHDSGIRWVSYFNGGDALHGFVRASYGFPQSNGCVEMPVANAAVVFPLTPIGTLVTVS